MPSPLSTSSSVGSSRADFAGYPEHRVISATKPEKALLYIIVGIVSFIILCIILVLCIVIGYRRKKVTSSQTDLSDGACAGGGDTMRSTGVSTSGQGILSSTAQSNGGLPVGSPGFHVCDEQDLIKEQETNRFLTNYSDLNSVSAVGSSHIIQQPSGSNNTVSFADENPYASNTLNSSTYGWTELNNPYCLGNTLPGYRGDFSNSHQPPQQQQQQQQQPGYVPNYYNQPMYSKPIPKHQRSNLYSNPNASLTLPQSPSVTSSQSSQNIGSTLPFRQNMVANLVGPGAGSSGSNNSSSGDERVPSISPPLEGIPEQMRLISSASNTPTKSILKKPKNNNLPVGADASVATLGSSSTPLRQEDQSSQSSSGCKDERCSESSNVSFSDRDTPTATTGEQQQPQASVIEQPAKKIVELQAENLQEPDYSPSNTYLETSFDLQQQQQQAGAAGDSSKIPPPTLPKPRFGGDEPGAGNSSTLDKRVRNITQV